MIRYKITDFTMEYGGYAPMPVALPWSLYSALASAGHLPPLDFGCNTDALASLPGGGVTLWHSLSVSDAVLASSHVGLVLSGVCAPCAVYLGATLVGEIPQGRDTATFEIGAALVGGARRLSVVFALDARRTSGAGGAPFGDVGIGASVELLAYEDACIEDVGVRQIHENGNVTLHISEKLRGNLGEMKSIVTLVSPTGKMYYCGLLRGKGTIRIPDPDLWWVHTHGKGKLYRLTLTLYRDGEPYDAKTVNVGLRSLTLADGKCPFALALNGTPLFVTGAQYRPDAPCHASRRAHMEERIRALAAAGVNYLRVREDFRSLGEDFFELCDRYGILVGITLSPSSADAELSVMADELYRIGHHPCLALLHTEIDDGALVGRIATLVETSVPGAVYRNRAVDFSRPVESFDYGSAFATARSTPSLPSATSLDRFLSPKEQNPFSFVAESRTVGSFAKTLAEAGEEYPAALSASQLIYLSQIHQAFSLQAQIEYLRLRRDRSGGVVIADATDARGSISPSLLDFYGVPKVALPLLRAVYAPTALLVRRDGYRVTLFVSNERRTPVSGTLRYALLDARGVVLRESTETVTVDAGSLSEVASSDFSTLAHKREREVVLVATLVTEDDCARLTRSVFFVPKKHFAFLDPEISVEVRGSGAEFEIALTPHAYAHAVVLSLSGYDAVFSDNGFDLIRNAPYLVRVQLRHGTADAETVHRALRIDTLASLGRSERI